MSEKAVLIVTATPNPNEMEALKRYQEKATQLLTEGGGTNLQRYEVQSSVAGNQRKIVALLDFESVEQIEAVLNSADYRTIIPDRDKGFADIDIFIGQS